MSVFHSIFGQARAIETLEKAIAAGRLPHGVVFAGPAGVGKQTTARALAKWFLCEKPSGVDACRECSSCVAVDANAHPDFHVVYRQLVRLSNKDSKARDLSIDVVREFVIEPAGRSSVLGRGKVFVVEDADLMNASAANALLKTLEEPAGRTLIVLLTDQPEALLPTIRSRCQPVRFVPLDEGLVKEKLIERGVETKLAGWAARLSEGSLGTAIRWIDDGVIAAAMELSAPLEAALAGDGAALQEWLKKSAEAYGKAQIARDAKASEDQAKREGVVVYLKLAGQFVRAKMKQTTDAEALERLCAAIDAAARAETYVDSNVNVPLVAADYAGQLGRS